MWRDILVHVDGSDAGREHVRYARSLARAMGAKLEGVHVTQPPDVPPVYKPSMIDKVEKYQEQEAQLYARSARRTFQEIADRSAVWHTTQGDVTDKISELSAYSDLVLVGQYETSGPPQRYPLTLAASLALRCGRPLLMLPVGYGDFPTKPRVLLAWDGNPHSSRAMHDALPLFRKAQSLRVLTVNPEEEGLDKVPYKALLAGHLRHHGVHVTNHVVVHGERNHGALIKKHLDPKKVDVLVIGAYTHSPWFELFFGGATQSMVLSSPVPVLLSH